MLLLRKGSGMLTLLLSVNDRGELDAVMSPACICESALKARLLAEGIVGSGWAIEDAEAEAEGRP